MQSTHTPIAHAARDAAGAWRPPHDLEAHLLGVAQLAEQFAQTYGPGWARLAGRWHDLGKYRPRFQHYIRQASGFEADAQTGCLIRLIDACDAPCLAGAGLLDAKAFMSANYGRHT